MLQKILLVEDDPATANLETRILERNGYSVVGAATGEEAVQATRQNADLDLILMDIDLGPGIKGTEAARIILSERDDVPLAFLSSHTDRETVELTEGITSYGYILKNSGTVVLLASIKMAFRLHEARQNEMAHKARLQDSERRYRQLFEQNPLPLWVYDLEDLHFLAVNEAACIKYGYSLEQFLGMTISDIRPADDSDALKHRVEHLRAVESEYSSSGIWRHCLRSGDIIYVEVIGHHIVFQGRQGRLILARDVTKQVAAEEEVQRQLREKENLLQQSYQRSRNHFQAMEELLKLRSHDVQSDEGRKVIVETISRVAGLRILYDRLLIARDREDISTSRYFEDLGKAILSAYSRYGGIRLET
ncbi:MAG: PAS domain S-box protein, partial [Leptospiraceae bacterium]|nr:PAS domain S-box protein [Leptospiraceae bacterium]